MHWHVTVEIAFSLQYLSHALEMIKKIYLTLTLTLEFFVFHLPNLFLTTNYVYPTLFSSVPPPPKVKTGPWRKKTLWDFARDKSVEIKAVHVLHSLEQISLLDSLLACMFGFEGFPHVLWQTFIYTSVPVQVKMRTADNCDIKDVWIPLHPSLET
jgi:Na+(H+)/acetate symporter ActP